MPNELTTELVKEKISDYVGVSLRYKDLTDLLGLKYYRGGNARDSQIKEIERYVDMEKNSTKYLINGIKAVPDEKIDKRTEGKYVSKIALLLADYLLQKNEYDGEGYVAVNTLNDWFIALGMTNRKYTSDEYKTKLIDLGIYTDWEVREFDTVSRDMLRDIFVRALNSLKKKGAIMWCDTFMVEGEQGVIRLATDEEVSEILKIQAVTFDKFKSKYNKEHEHDKLYKYKDVYNRDTKVKNKFSIEFRQALAESNLNITKAWKVYKIIYSDVAIRLKLEELENEVLLHNGDITKVKYSLNDKVVDAYYTRVDTRAKNNQEAVKIANTVTIDKRTDSKAKNCKGIGIVRNVFEFKSNYQMI
nr:hypothetical protein [uncultured Anaerosporobacter sp.]